MPWLSVTELICVTYDHGYVPYIILSSVMTYHRSKKKRGKKKLMEQELITTPEHLSSPRFN
jgi:hypothetical protein